MLVHGQINYIYPCLILSEKHFAVFVCDKNNVKVKNLLHYEVHNFFLCMA